MSWLLTVGLGLVDRYGKIGEYGRVVKQRAVGVQQLTMEVKLLDIGK
ncbi:MAG: hypothetical protein U0946_07405 [Patescibacteria group bacterium]|nr:hypothetical protein [Patescibacteria group bacterium]